jgi:CHAT domain-containing protein
VNWGKDLRLIAPGTNKSHPALIVSVPAHPDLDQLRNAEAESEEIAAVLGSGSVQLAGPPATASALLQHCRAPRVLHLATHGYWSEEIFW